MKSILSKILTFFLTIIVLFSSVSFTIEKHFCGGQLYSESFFGNAEKCGMDDGDGDCMIADNNPCYSKKSCCEDEIKFINGSIFEKESGLKIINKHQQNLSIFTLIETILFYEKENELTHFKNYIPPSKTHNFNILYQVFRL